MRQTRLDVPDLANPFNDLSNDDEGSADVKHTSRLEAALHDDRAATHRDLRQLIQESSYTIAAAVAEAVGRTLAHAGAFPTVADPSQLNQPPYNAFGGLQINQFVVDPQPTTSQSTATSTWTLCRADRV